MQNHLKDESSPYLLQHASNPVDWYPWGEEAFARAKAEDKPVFLSIGYSTCHWCHVMAHESFEDEEIAALLNGGFISVKVDKEERPDIDSIYMAVCQAFTGSGGWPTSIFMTAEQKPFFAGTYFPKTTRGRMAGLKELLALIREKWDTDRQALLEQAERVVDSLRARETQRGSADISLAEAAVGLYRQSYDRVNGGFGGAPKFPSPHNLIFLLDYYERYRDAGCLQMAEHTLTQMYRGGMFDHIGYGFCRYSTDERFLAPHFEKMLYDNAMLILAYSKACAVTGKPLYLDIAEKTAGYVLRELASPEGGFYSAQDADSDGEEGKYYLFSPKEITGLLGEERGGAFNRRFGISEEGNFEGKSIPNLLESGVEDDGTGELLPKLRRYRRERCRLHLDDKALASWNGLMTAALCALYRAGGNRDYLEAAKRADRFIEEKLCRGDTLFVSFREGRLGVKGFLDDYAACAFAKLSLYAATLEQRYLERAKALCGRALRDFKDGAKGGFYLYANDGEGLILRPKESYDGAIPSGNSLMAWNLVRLFWLTSDEGCRGEAERQLDFIAAEAARYPAGYAMFLSALLDFYDPPPTVKIVPARGEDGLAAAKKLPYRAVASVWQPSESYPLRDGRTTFYICKNNSCLPPVNELDGLEL